MTNFIIFIFVLWMFFTLLIKVIDCITSLAWKGAKKILWEMVARRRISKN